MNPTLRRTLRLALLSLLLFGLWTPLNSQTVTVESFRGRSVASGRIIVQFRASGLTQSRTLASQDADIAKVDPVGETGAVLLHSRGRKVAELLQAYQNRADVLYAEPDFKLSTQDIPNDAAFGQQWAFVNAGQSINGQTGSVGADIKSSAAWDITSGGRSFVIGIVDTGIDYNHPDLTVNLWTAPTAFSVVVAGQTIACEAGTHGFNAITKTCDPADDNGHGTHVAGIIGAAGNNGFGVSGVNRIASMIALKFTAADGTGFTSDAVAAIEFARKAKAFFGGAGGGADIRILNNSWGSSGGGTTLRNAFTLAGNSTNNMLSLTAAGNNTSSNDETPFYPSSYSVEVPSVVSVTATDNQDALAGFSNFGAASVNLGAPGVSIYSTVPSSAFGFKSGTSMATPMAAGAAALVLSACPTLTTAQLKATLLDPASLDAIPALAGKTTTGGRLNVFKALLKCGSNVPASTFRLTATPGATTIAAGGSAENLVTMTPVGSFSANVGLSANTPAGIAASLTSTTLTGASPAATLTMTVGSGVAAGTYLVGVTGTSGATIAATGVALTIVPPIINDNFANATVIGSTPFSNSIDTTGASAETTDPVPPCGNVSKPGSVWYRFTASTAGTITANTFDSDYSTIVSAYIGSAGAFTPVASGCNDDFGGPQSGVFFPVVAGNTYYLMVSTNGGIGGLLNFNLTFLASPIPPILTSILPNSGSPGAAVNVTIRGTAFDSSLAVNAASGITVSNIVTVNSSLATATLTIGTNAIPGSGNLSVTTSADGTSNAITFTVNPPSYLTRLQGDFNGDGKIDILWQHTDGRVDIWLMNGLGPIAGSELITAGTGWSVKQRGDFNGDGKTDILWQHTDGRVAIWLMNGLFPLVGAGLLGPGTNWSAAQVGDFDGDGKTDILWQHTDGSTAAWLMNGLTVSSSASLMGPGTGWSAKQIGDFDGDGKSDILWQHTDGSTAIWLMNGLSLSSGAKLLVPTGWSANRTGNFNGDGQDDIVWQHTDGRTAAWLMNGLSLIGGAVLGGPNTNSTIRRMGDFNGDGKTDILWENSDGSTVLWLMDGLSIIGNTVLLGPDSGWSVFQVGDFNGDGKSDIVWHHTNGSSAIWLMDGMKLSAGSVLIGPGTGWSPAP